MYDSDCGDRQVACSGKKLLPFPSGLVNAVKTRARGALMKRLISNEFSLAVMVVINRHQFFSINSFSDVPMSDVQPAAKFARAKLGSGGEGSHPKWAAPTRGFSPPVRPSKVAGRIAPHP